MLTGFSPAVRLVFDLLSFQTQAAKAVLVKMLTGSKVALQYLLLLIAGWNAMNVGISHPDSTKSGASRACVKVDLPARAGSIRLVEATQLFSQRTLEQIAEVVKAVQGIQRAPLVSIARGDAHGVSIYL